MNKYIPSKIEPKWQKKWAEANIYHADDASLKPKKYILDMFPYPSGDGLHVGHFKIYNASDIISRYFRLKGFNVLHPMGWDAFGLNAENYAIKNKIHPKIIIQKSINNIRRQMQMVGFSYDWAKEVNTTDPNYYKWTQWIFLKLFEKGLAYEAEVPINWCPKDKTGLANEEVIAGKCERCGTPVEQKVIRQWLLKITDYADRLLEGVQNLDWPRSIKDMQINWIGRKEGINISYQVEESKEQITCFTTRPDTNFGATFIVVGPEHPLIQKISKKEYLDTVNQYINRSINKSEEERIAQGRAKTGVFTGSYAINNLNGQKLPIWVSDFVLGHVGTGAVVGVPGHDLRDFEFAKAMDLPIIRVVVGKDKDKSAITEAKQVQEDEGVIINSEFLNGLDIHEATKVSMDHLEAKGWGKRVVSYHLRDWVFSRQRYWGEPIPVIHCPKDGVVAVPEQDLPVKLPEVESYQPTGTGESPLAAISDWVNTTCPKCGGSGKRETNTMPQWAGSCWYYLRFTDPNNSDSLISKDNDKYWLPVDWYLGGAEHAVLHLLYARFWHLFLYDYGVVSTKEPFQKLSSVGLVLAADGRKMSKSLGNVVNPDDIVKEYGADTLRVYEAFMGPFENAIAWEPGAINGAYRFLVRVWELVQNNSEQLSKPEDQKIRRSDHTGTLSHSEPFTVEVALNKLIKKIAQDIESLNLNTAISSFMEFVNFCSNKSLTLDQKRKFLIILSPFAPHITEELWQIIRITQNNSDKPVNQKTRKSEILKHQVIPSYSKLWSIHSQPWPEVEEKYLAEDQINLVIQVNGKVRENIMIDKEILSNSPAVEKLALSSPKVQKFVQNATPKKVIYIPGKIINFVI